MNLTMPQLKFPCQPQNIVDFVSQVIRRQAIVQLNYEDGYHIRYSYKDFLWDTSNHNYPLIIVGEGNFNCQGYTDRPSGSWLGPHRLALIKIVEGWI